MAKPFKNSYSANKAFGVFFESKDAGDYIYNKRAKATYCNTKISNSSPKIGTVNNYLLFKRSKKINDCPRLNSINNSNLNINLITKLELSDVAVLQDVSSNSVPATVSQNSIPFLDYNIDPSGSLFGNTICGINNWEKYMVYNYDINDALFVNI